MKYGFIALGMLSTSALAGTAVAADVTEEQIEARINGAAVSEINGKIEFGYLHVNADTQTVDESAEGAFVQGAISIPVGQQFGLQIDAGYADLEGASVQGIGAHLFWRDPSVGLLGAYGHYIDLDNDLNTTQLGIGAEVYRGQLSLELFAGKDKLETPIGDDDFFIGEAIAAYYVNDNFRVSGGVRHSFDDTKAVVGFEAMSDTGGVSPALFATAEFSDNVTTISGGLKFYFGSASKSLIRRHREDDPRIKFSDRTGDAAGCAAIAGAEANEFGRRKVRPRIDDEPSNTAIYDPYILFEPVLNGCGASPSAIRRTTDEME